MKSVRGPAQPKGAIDTTGTTASPASLPDVNAETYPYEMVQYLLDQTADFNMFVLPVPRYGETASLTPGDPNDFFGLNAGYGIAFASTIHRFDSIAHAPTLEDIKVTQRVGDPAGRFQCRCLFCPDDFQWSPGKMPPPVLYDPYQSQRFVMLDVEMTFDGGNSFRAYGVGRTFPKVINGRPQILVGGVGNIAEGSGKFASLEGTYVVTGTLTPELGLLGNITCRVIDPYGIIRSDREIDCMSSISDPAPTETFVVLRGVKKDSKVKTTYGPPPGGSLVSLITPSQMRSVQYDFTTGNGGNLHTEMRVGQAVANMSATVYFDLMTPPGTAERSVPFTTEEIYTFIDSKGRSVGTLAAGVVEGISFGLKFPAAQGQPGVRFAGFGCIYGGTGLFEGAHGMLTVNSVIGIAPHALSLLHVLHLADSEGKFRIAAGARSAKAIAPVPKGLRRDDPFHPLLEHKEGYVSTYIKWRDGFKKCSNTLSSFIAKNYNERLSIGEFSGLRIDPDNLKSIFDTGVQPFSLETFNRYAGRAKGVFRTYELATARELSEAVLYSVWNRTNVSFPDGRIGKKISGSNSGYYDPESLPPLSERRVDIILNSYRSDAGLTSWVEIYQRGRMQRTSFAYKLPHPHEILWFVKDVSLDGKPIHNNVFMASHEWKGLCGDRACYYMVGIFLEIDLDSCAISTSGNTFWRAFYDEEPD